MSSGLTPGGRTRTVQVRTERGFTLIEILVVVAIISVMTVMAIPLVQSTLAYYDLQAAVSAVSGTIQSTRYQAISSGYPYRVVFTGADHSYQIWSCSGGYDSTNPGACVFTKDKGINSHSVFGSSKVNLGQDTTIDFFPSGKVSFFDKSVNPITLSRVVPTMGSSKTIAKSLTVSTYGSVKVQ